MIKNIIFRIRALSLMTMVVWGAQNIYSQEKRHQFSVGAGGVFNFIEYELKDGQLDRGDGLSVNARYSYYLNENWSIGLGAEYQTFNSEAKIQLAQGSYVTTDSEGEAFEFRYSAAGLREKQNLKFINVPFNIQYEGADYPSFYASVGAKVGFAIKSTYETAIENVGTSGYYPQYEVELFDPSFMGFGNLGSVNQGKQDLDLLVSYIATFEAGMKHFENENMAVYLGLYFDYGLNSILKNDRKTELVEYTEEVPVDLKYNSVLTSGATDKIRVMAYGVKLRYAFW